MTESRIDSIPAVLDLDQFQIERSVSAPVELAPSREGVVLDLVHLAERTPDGWIIYQRTSNGTLKTIETVKGQRRHLKTWTAENNIVLTRAAEQWIDRQPEYASQHWRDRT